MTEHTVEHTHVAAEWIRRPLSDLGGSSPQDAATGPEGRKKLEDLFTELAGMRVRLAGLGLPAVDPGELRKALGIEAPAANAHAARQARAVRMGPVKRSALLDELGTALTGGDVDSVAFFNVKTGAIEHFMHNLGDQETARIAQAQADADMRKVTPVTTDVRYGIMSDFISLVEDIAVAGRLRSAISGKGAFRRFRETVDEDDALRRRWLAYRTKRHYLLALDWLHRLGHAPAQYGLNAADYDWTAPTEEAEAQSQPSMAEVAPEVQAQETAGSNGEAQDHTGEANAEAEPATNGEQLAEADAQAAT